jgi:Skp family chaperone for outer membrane proteins
MLRLVLRYLILAASFLSAAYGAGAGGDITIPLEDGSLVVQNVQLTMDGYLAVPGLSFTLRNRTSSPWTKLKLQFEIDARCSGEARHWSRTEETFLGWIGDPAFQHVNLTEEGKEKASLTVRTYSGRMLFPQGRVDGCVAETIKATLVEAENSKVRIDGVTGERIDLEKQRADAETAEAERERIAAEEQAERDRIAAEKQAKEDAAAAARQKRLAAERRKKQAEEDARYAKAKAEQDAKEAEERRQVRAACSAVYQSTADKKIGDLTVREEQQVRTCQALGLYPPH